MFVSVHIKCVLYLELNIIFGYKYREVDVFEDVKCFTDTRIKKNFKTYFESLCQSILINAIFNE